MKASLGDFTNQSVSFTSSSQTSVSKRPKRTPVHDAKINKVYSVKCLLNLKKKMFEILSANRANDVKNQKLSNKNLSVSKKVDSISVNFISSNQVNDSFDKLEEEKATPKSINLSNKKGVEYNKICKCSSCCSYSSKLHRHRYAGAVYRHRHLHLESRSSLFSERKKRRFVPCIGNHKIRKADQIRSDPCSCTFKSSVLPKLTTSWKKLRSENPLPILKYFRKAPKEKGKGGGYCKVVKLYESQYKTNLFCSKASRISCSTTNQNGKQNKPTAVMNFMNKILNTDLSLSSNHLLHINPFIKRSFCAMNLQVRHNRKKGFKLEPYECEPGVCVPGECDPFECQKRIMRRLMTKSHATTSTEGRTKSMSSETAYSHPDSRSQKQQFREYVAKPKLTQEGHHERHGIKHQTLPRNQKQAVRVGSSFSFNIEFSKDRSGTTGTAGSSDRKKSSFASTGTTWEGKQFKTKGTRGYRTGNHDGESQSSTAMHHKGSMVIPRQNRCFCTLKLQKRGKQQKEVHFKMGEKLPENVIKLTNRGQNTRKIRTYGIRNLDPNECEPNICIPGECDPYECLERIKKRNKRLNTKNYGTGTKSWNTSTSSMTSYNPTKGRYVQYKHKVRKPRLVGRDRSVSIVGHPARNVVNPLRQAVRIGSNFSFDIEFFKDKSIAKETKISALTPSDIYKRKRPGRTRKTQRNPYRAKSSEKTIQYSRSNRNQNEQVGTATKHKSTKTSSFLKRCFCTAKLYKVENHVKRHIGNAKGTQDRGINKREKRRSSAMSRMNHKFFKSGKHSDGKETVTSDPRYAGTHSQTDKTREKRMGNKMLKLEPYECEPGFCVPGQCDPYVCDERIRNRTANLNKMSSTDGPNTKSMYTYFKPVGMSKSTLSRERLPKYRNQHVKIRKQVKEKHIIKSPERNVVKIGSHFSFSTEFYKDKTSPEDYIVVKDPIRIKKKRAKMITRNTNGIKLKTKARRLGGAVSIFSRESQVDALKKEHRATGMGPMLKRCFCTLALQKQRTKKPLPLHYNNMVSHGTDSPNYKIVPDFKDAYSKTRQHKPHKLKPYECEPGVCTPGQCDPYECKKLIRKRLHRDSGTSTQRYHVRSSTTNAHRKKLKDGDAQSIQTHTRPSVKRKQHQNRYKSHEQGGNRHVSHNKQAVRIGSNFSFSMEFYKNRSLSPATGNHSLIGEHKLRRKNSMTSSQAINVHHNNSMTSSQAKNVHRHSQIDTHRMESKASGVGHLMERCFCTLKLQKVGKQQHKTNINKIKLEPEKTSIDMSVATKTKYEPALYRETGTKAHNMKRFLEPYECEPGTCVPGFCNPEECYERIKRRHLRTSCIGTDKALMKSVSSGIADERRYQFRKVQTPMDKGFVTQSQQFRSPMVVEVPRFKNLNNWQGVKIGSNINVSIEFYKEIKTPNSLPVFDDDVKANTVRVYDKNNNANFTNNEAAKKYTNTYSNMMDSQSQASQVTENKASAAGKVLKRCFCTAKLHQTGAGNMSKRAITVERVDRVETMTPFKLNCDIKKNKNTKIDEKYLENTIYHQNNGKPQKYHHNKQKIYTAPRRKRQSFVYKKRIGRQKPEKLKALTNVKISGNELTKNISMIYDPYLEEGTTIVMVGGTDVEFKMSKDSAAAGDKERKINIKKKQNVHNAKYKCAEKCSYCKFIRDKGVVNRFPLSREEGDKKSDITGKSKESTESKYGHELKKHISAKNNQNRVKVTTVRRARSNYEDNKINKKNKKEAAARGTMTKQTIKRKHANYVQTKYKCTEKCSCCKCIKDGERKNLQWSGDGIHTKPYNTKNKQNLNSNLQLRDNAHKLMTYISSRSLMNKNKNKKMNENYLENTISHQNHRRQQKDPRTKEKNYPATRKRRSLIKTRGNKINTQIEGRKPKEKSIQRKNLGNTIFHRNIRKERRGKEKSYTGSQLKRRFSIKCYGKMINKQTKPGKHNKYTDVKISKVEMKKHRSPMNDLGPARGTTVVMVSGTDVVYKVRQQSTATNGHIQTNPRNKERTSNINTKSTTINEKYLGNTISHQGNRKLMKGDNDEENNYASTRRTGRSLIQSYRNRIGTEMEPNKTILNEQKKTQKTKHFKPINCCHYFFANFLRPQQTDDVVSEYSSDMIHRKRRSNHYSAKIGEGLAKNMSLSSEPKANMAETTIVTVSGTDVDFGICRKRNYAAGNKIRKKTNNKNKSYVGKYQCAEACKYCKFRLGKSIPKKVDNVDVKFTDDAFNIRKQNKMQKPKINNKIFQNIKDFLRKYILPYQTEKMVRGESLSNNDNMIGKKRRLNRSHVQKETTVVKISGDDLTQNISLLYDPNAKMANTTVVTVGGIDVDCKVSRERKGFLGDTKKRALSKENQNYHSNNKNQNYVGKYKCAETCSNRKIKKAEDVETILPYTPRKFNQKKSKTSFHGRNHPNKSHDYCCSKCRCFNEFNRKVHHNTDENLFYTREKSLINKQSAMKRIFNACCSMLSKQKCQGECVRAENKLGVENFRSKKTWKDNLKKSKSERKHQKLFSEPKLSKRVKSALMQANNTKQKTQKKMGKSFPLQSDYADRKASTFLIESKLLCNCQELYKAGPHKRVKFALENGELKKDVRVKNQAIMPKPKSEDEPNISHDHKEKFVPPVGYTEIKISGRGLKKDICSSKNPKNDTVVTLSGNYVDCEISKKAVKDLDECEATCSFCKKCLCYPCKCPPYGARLTIKGKHKDGPCVCGSAICAKVKKIQEAKKAAVILKKKEKPCVCASPICNKLNKQYEKRQGRKSKHVCVCNAQSKKDKICECEKIETKTHILKGRKQKKMFEKLDKVFGKEDRLRMKQRIAKERAMEKQVQKYRNSGAALLLLESVVDIGKLGFTAVTDVARSSYKTIRHPKYTFHVMKTMLTNPKQGCAICCKFIRDSGIVSTLKRIQMRFAAMNFVKATKEELESHNLTNFMLHVADNDPKKRMKRKKKKKIRKREPIDFQCSLYMASLRKRPFLSVYYLWPWFYPHCISFLRLWKQVSDVVLFLLAVAVWCPCILAMEICRAFVCCCLCGG